VHRPLYQILFAHYMAPLFQAVGSKYASTDSDGVVVFEGSMDEEWATGLYVHGSLNSAGRL
jgi:hypothetical protein